MTDPLMQVPRRETMSENRRLARALVVTATAALILIPMVNYLV